MKIKNLLVVGILSIIFLVISFFYAQSIIEYGKSYKETMQDYVEVLDFNKRLLSSKEWLASGFNSDYEWGKKRVASEILLREAESAYRSAINESIKLIYLSLGFFLLVFILYLRGEYFRKAMAGCLMALSICYLYVGVFTPMLEISAFSEDLTIPIELDTELISVPIVDGINYASELTKEYLGLDLGTADPVDYSLFKKDVVFKGKTYYFHQSKSIADLIGILFKDKNYVVAWAILAFSVLLPILKIILTLLITFVKPLRKEGPFLTFVKIIGKWSMADVFVASSFLVFLSFNNMNVGVQNDSKVLLGLYFFLAYVVISITASIFVWFAIRRTTNIKLYELVA
jgi:hypothetical protein